MSYQEPLIAQAGGTTLSNKKHVPRHYPDETPLRDRNGHRWIRLDIGDHYIQEGMPGTPAVTFQRLASKHGPMIKEHS